MSIDLIIETKDNVNLSYSPNLGNITTKISRNYINATISANTTAEILGLGNVDNTSDINKPISIATQSALNTKLNITDFISQFYSQFDTDDFSIIQNSITPFISIASEAIANTLVLKEGRVGIGVLDPDTKFQITDGTSTIKMGDGIAPYTGYPTIWLDQSILTNSNFALRARGTGTFLNAPGTLYFSIGGINLAYLSNTKWSFNSPGITSGAVPYIGFEWIQGTRTNQYPSTEISGFLYTLNSRQWQAGNISLQREVLYTQPTYSFTGASIITDAATIGISGAPTASTGASISNSHSLLISSSAVGSGVTNSYGLTVNAQSGALNNYAAVFSGGNVGIGTVTPTQALEVSGTIKAGTIWGSSTLRANDFYVSASGIYSGASSRDLISVETTTAGGAIPWRISSGNSSFTGGYIAFNTTGNEVMRIDENGKIGIGTASPGAQLDVIGTTRLYSGTGEIGTIIRNDAGIILQLQQSGATPVMTVLNSGSLGLGTITPAYLLDVNGYARSTRWVAGSYTFLEEGTLYRVQSGQSISMYTRKVDLSYNTNQFVLDSTGKIGIGKNNPSTLLDVAGSITSDGDIITSNEINGFVLKKNGNFYRLTLDDNLNILITQI